MPVIVPQNPQIAATGQKAGDQDIIDGQQSTSQTSMTSAESKNLFV